jgi:hypothetical protein
MSHINRQSLKYGLIVSQLHIVFQSTHPIKKSKKDTTKSLHGPSPRCPRHCPNLPPNSLDRPPLTHITLSTARYAHTTPLSAHTTCSTWLSDSYTVIRLNRLRPVLALPTTRPHAPYSPLMPPLVDIYSSSPILFILSSSHRHRLFILFVSSLIIHLPLLIILCHHPLFSPLSTSIFSLHCSHAIDDE